MLDCPHSGQTIDTGDGLRVTVSCDMRSFKEGEDASGTPRTVRVYTLDAVACSGSTACPDAAAAVSGELDRGTLELLLSQPVPRNRLILAHFLVDLVVILLGSFRDENGRRLENW